MPAPHPWVRSVSRGDQFRRQETPCEQSEKSGRLGDRETKILLTQSDGSVSAPQLLAVGQIVSHSDQPNSGGKVVGQMRHPLQPGTIGEVVDVVEHQ